MALLCCSLTVLNSSQKAKGESKPVLVKACRSTRVHEVVCVHVAQVLQQRHQQQLVLDGRSEIHKLL